MQHQVVMNVLIHSGISFFINHWKHLAPLNQVDIETIPTIHELMMAMLTLHTMMVPARPHPTWPGSISGQNTVTPMIPSSYHHGAAISGTPTPPAIRYPRQEAHLGYTPDS